MGSSPSTPAPPDYSKLAKDQGDIDQMALLQQTISNRPNQKNPFGEIQWTMDPDTGQWTQEEVYDPRLQGLADKSLATQDTLQDRTTGLAGRGNWQTTPGAEAYDPGQWGIEGYDTQNQIGQFDQQMNDEYARNFTEAQLARIRPQQAVDQRQMETRLRLQGLQPGTEAYNRAYQNLLTSQGDVNAQATLQGMLAGGAEGRSMYETALKGQLARGSEGRDDYNTRLGSALQQAQGRRADYATQMMGQDQMNTQSLQEWMQPYADIESTQSLANAFNQFRPGYQSFTSANGAAGADMMGAAQQQYASQVQRANDAAARKQQQGAMWGSIIGAGIGTAAGGNTALGGAAGGAIGGYFSDVALKENVEVISDKDAYDAMLRIQPHTFTWPNGRRGTGLIAQQVRREFPHLVHEVEQGYLKVDYETFTAILLGAFRHLATLKAQE